VIVKGVKFSLDGKEISPIIHVCRVLEVEPLLKTNAAEAAQTICLLDNDYVATADAMNADTNELGSDNEAVLLAYTEAKGGSQDEETDSAYAS